MTTIPTEELSITTGGTQGWLHPKEEPSETAGVHSAHDWATTGGFWTGRRQSEQADPPSIKCTGGLWTGCAKKED
jgi:hypothetical protein